MLTWFAQEFFSSCVAACIRMIIRQPNPETYSKFSLNVQGNELPLALASGTEVES